jgi:leader peptidase (prepilin peptidase)/N-methyltransferase
VLGLLIGSFLNVVVWRVPRGESVVSPPSACPDCGTAIRHRDNVPVAGWLLLAGRCRDCEAPISARYPLVEAATAGLFAVTAAALRPRPGAAGVPLPRRVGLALALIDLDCKRLPNALTLPSYPSPSSSSALRRSPAAPAAASAEHCSAGLAMYAVYFALCFAYPAGMGFGDVKLAGVLGLYVGWLGWGEWAVALFLGFLLGAVFGIALMAVRRGGRKTAVPFGPFMLLGTLIAVLWGGRLADLYLATTGL